MKKTVIINGEEWPIISEYTMNQGIEDGILVEVGEIQRDGGSKITVVFIQTLFEEGGYEDKTKRVALVTRGIELLKNSDPEDTEYMRLRVIEKGKIWVIHDGNGITFLKPEDY
jgi:hypothetical protein